MMRHYTERELIERIRRARGLAVLGHESWCASDEHIDARIAEELRVWYARLLRTAPAERLPVRDLKEQVQECRYTAAGGLALRLPREGRRLVEVRLPEWRDPVRVFHAPGSGAERRQRDSLRRSTVADPVAVLDGDVLTLYALAASVRNAVSPDPGARLERLLMTAPPAEGGYTFEDEDFLLPSDYR